MSTDKLEREIAEATEIIKNANQMLERAKSMEREAQLNLLQATQHLHELLKKRDELNGCLDDDEFGDTWIREGRGAQSRRE